MPELVCPRCERSLSLDHECERIHRGRRYFFLGALALPLAAKVAPLVPKPMTMEIATISGRWRAPTVPIDGVWKQAMIQSSWLIPLPRRGFKVT